SRIKMAAVIAISKERIRTNTRHSINIYFASSRAITTSSAIQWTLATIGPPIGSPAITRFRASMGAATATSRGRTVTTTHQRGSRAMPTPVGTTATMESGRPIITSIAIAIGAITAAITGTITTAIATIRDGPL